GGWVRGRLGSRLQGFMDAEKPTRQPATPDQPGAKKADRAASNNQHPPFVKTHARKTTVYLFPRRQLSRLRFATTVLTLKVAKKGRSRRARRFELQTPKIRSLLGRSLADHWQDIDVIFATHLTSEDRILKQSRKLRRRANASDGAKRSAEHDRARHKFCFTSGARHQVGGVAHPRQRTLLVF